MEADWEVEIGGDAPVIDATWTGFIDLRTRPDRVWEISEIRHLPALAQALCRLNAQSSSVWTAKCDVWSVDALDPIELDASPGSSNSAVALYIDLLPRSDQQWAFPQKVIASCEEFCTRLHRRPVRACRADLIVRCASIAPGVKDLGVTAYLTACGSAESEAAAQLANALAAFVDAVCGAGTPSIAASTLQLKSVGE